MTGDEIITLARSHFGESTANTVSTDSAKSYLNTALQELFNDLPPERMRERLTEEAVTINAEGQGDALATWDRLVEIYVNDIPAMQVHREVIRNVDFGNMFSPGIPIVHVDNFHVWVRPKNSTVKVVHLVPPTPIEVFTNEVSAFPEMWHPALAFLTASLMYAQEEDQVQASHYRGEYAQMLTNLLTPAEAESE